MKQFGSEGIETPFDMPETPEGWQIALLGQIAQIVGGGTPKTSDSSNFSEGEYPWITPADLSGFNEMYISRGRRSLSEQGLKTSSAVLMPKGTVLMSSRAPIGYLAIAANELCTNQGFKSFICPPGVTPEYVFFWLKFITPFLENMGSGSTFLEISGSRARKIPILLAPTSEQNRIVGKVEELLARVNTAKERLGKVPTILKRFRQAVLAAAFTGDFTDELDIAGEKRQEANRFVAELWEVRKKEILRISLCENKGNSAQPKVKHSKVDQSDIDFLQKIPSHWQWTSFSTCTDVADGTHDSPKYHNSGVPLVTSKNLTPEGIDFSNVKFISDSDHAKISRRSAVADVDILFAMIGTVGNPTIVNGGHPFSIKNVGLFRTFGNKQLAKYLKYWLTSPFIQNYFQETSKGSTQPFAPLNVLRKLPVPIPPKSEFKEIISRIEALFELAEVIEKRVTIAKLRAEKLTQAILSKAFRGELVSTEAELARREGRSYEIASELLTRIKSEREPKAALRKIPQGQGCKRETKCS